MGVIFFYPSNYTLVEDSHDVVTGCGLLMNQLNA